MNFEEFLLWCTVMLPLIVSPGPANIATASVSSSLGFKGTIPFMLGLTTVNCFIVALTGLGMGLIYVKYRTLFSILEHLGALYIVYLGVKIFCSKRKEGAVERPALGFFDGVTLQALNPKLYPSLIMMFSLFIDGDAAATTEVVVLASLATIAAIFSYIGWASFGMVLYHSQSRWTIWLQSYGFGSMLVVVGIWLFFHSFFC